MDSDEVPHKPIGLLREIGLKDSGVRVDNIGSETRIPMAAMGLLLRSELADTHRQKRLQYIP